jgi:hypothetical protein
MRDLDAGSVVMLPTPARLCCLLLLLLSAAGCGGSSSTSTSSSTDTTGTSASGDIPDTATYLTFRSQGYSLKYVEGWGIQLGPGAGVTIADKDSAETVAPLSGGASILAFASSDLARLARSSPRYTLLVKRNVKLAPGPSVYVQYHTLSPRDPVTGKRVPVVVDRYYIPGPRKRAILTLQTPVGVDNVDAFRLIAHSFRWR